MNGVLAGCVYATALAGLVVAGAGAVALAAGTGLWGLKRLLFVLGFALLGLAALQWRPAPAWSGRQGGAPEDPWLARRVRGMLGESTVVPVAPARTGAAALVLATSFLLETAGI